MPYWPSLATCHTSCEGGNPSTKSCTSWAYLLVLLSSHQTVVSVFLAKSRVPSQNLWMKRKRFSTTYMIIRVWMELHVPGAPFTPKHVQNVHIIQNECVYHIKYLGSRMVPPWGLYVCHILSTAKPWLPWYLGAVKLHGWLSLWTWSCVLEANHVGVNVGVIRVHNNCLSLNDIFYICIMLYTVSTRTLQWVVFNPWGVA